MADRPINNGRVMTGPVEDQMNLLPYLHHRDIWLIFGKVSGEKDPACLGVTLTHEHLYLDAPHFFVSLPGNDNSMLPFNMRNLGWIRQNPYSHKPNLTLTDEDSAVKEELAFFKKNGGHTIVENTTIGIDRNLSYLRSLEQISGVNIIAGTGFYVDPFQTEAVRNYSEEKMASIIRSDFLEGVDGVRCGILGEVGTSWPITDFERRSLRSAAAVQSELGCPISVHPGRSSEAPDEIIRILLEAGAKAGHCVIAHLDRTFLDYESVLEFASMGTYLEYDLFGIETSHYQLCEKVDMPSDAQRIGFIKALLNGGYEDRILVAHDIHTKHRLMKYGGHGFSHILVNIVPKMLSRGITQAQVDKILKHNPHTWLQFFK